MPERKNHQDSKVYGGSPLRFKMSIPTFTIPSVLVLLLPQQFRGPVTPYYYKLKKSSLFL